MLFCCWNRLVLERFSELLSFPVGWISLDLICRLLDNFVLLFLFFADGLEDNPLLCFVLFCICGGDGSHL